MSTQNTPSATFQVRRVRKGLWTYDIYPSDGSPAEFSIGECGSRRHAEKSAKAAIKALLQ
jgi:hypothetical protein